MDKKPGEKAKVEIAAVVMRGRREKLAFLSAIIHTAGSIIISNGTLSLSLESESEFIKDRVDEVLREIYKSEASVEGKRSFTLSGKYLDRLLSDCRILSSNENGREIVAGIDSEIVADERCCIAYIRGAYLGCGSLSVSSGYHLEFSLSNPQLAAVLILCLARLNIEAKNTVRKDKYIVYIKTADTVCDILALMGAPISVIEINEMIARRYVSRLSNRRLNCDMANIDKTVSTSLRQIDAINTLKGAGVFKTLDTKLTEAGEVRLSLPDAPLSELAAALNISKSGLIHRLNKLTELAEGLNKNDGS